MLTSRPGIVWPRLVVAVTALACAGVVVPASATTFFRTNISGSNQTSFAEYASLADLAAGNDISGGGIDINPDIPTSSYIFYDGNSFYKTTINTSINSGINTVIQYTTLANLAGDVSGVTYELKSGGSAAQWSLNDDFYADGLGNYYRNSTANVGGVDVSNGVTQYPSLTDFVNNTNGSASTFQSGGSTITYGAGDRFFADGGEFYRTSVSGSNVASFDRYASFADLVAGVSAGTTASSVAWSTSDQFVAVPEPGSGVPLLVAIGGVWGLAMRKQRRPTAATHSGGPR